MTYISPELRRRVAARANGCCEYCRLHQDDFYLQHEVDHAISEKHRGLTVFENLCFSCFECNRYKGSDVGSIDVETNTFVALYNPRTDRWEDHFLLSGAEIVPKTAVGRVTVFLLRLNSEVRLERRKGLIEMQRYPCDYR